LQRKVRPSWIIPLCTLCIVFLFQYLNSQANITVNNLCSEKFNRASRANWVGDEKGSNLYMQDAKRKWWFFCRYTYQAHFSFLDTWSSTIRCAPWVQLYAPYSST
jgi:hypothetical protein